MFKTSNSISNKTNELTSAGSGSAGAGEGTRNILYSLLEWLKNNRTSINGVKLFGLLIINTWLLILFWKIFMLEGINLVGNNVGLTKMQTVMQPVLMYLGLEMLSPSSIKLIIFSTIVISVNIIILNFNTVVILAIPLGLARYGYKMHSNYLINQENIAIMNQKAVEVLPKAVEQAPVIINTGQNSGTNWWLWAGVAIAVTTAVIAIGLTIWSHNTNANNLAGTSEASLKLSHSINDRINIVNENFVALKKQVDLNNISTRSYVNNINEHFDVLEKKIDNNFKAVDKLEENYNKILHLNQENTFELSQKSLEIAGKAATTMQEMSEISGATEGVVVGLAKIYDIIKDFSERLTLAETKIESLSNTTTPRSMGSSMYRVTTTNIPKIVVTNNNNIEN